MKPLSVLVAIALVFCFLHCSLSETVTGDPTKTLGGVSVEYDGTIYRYKRRITSILLLGTDQWTADLTSSSQFRHGSQADFLLLLGVDDNARTVFVLQINRDSMTDITITNLLGQPIGKRKSQICLSYSYGDGGVESCRLTAQAVAEFLSIVPVDHYYSVNLDAISAFNELMGGIKVPIEDDFSMYDPSMIQGQTLTLLGKQAEYYVRSRYYIGDGSNAARMKRQKAYLEAAKQVLTQKVEESPYFLLDLFDALAPYSHTDMSRGYIMNFANRAREYEVLQTRALDGTQVIGENGFIEFQVDEDNLKRTLIEFFYEPIK